MKVYSIALLAVSIIATLSFVQNNTNTLSKERSFFLNQYDSSYDFSEIRTRNRNPKDLIGQELEFAPPSTNHVIGSEASLFYRLRDSLFICFSSPVTKKLSELTNIFPEKSTGFDLVDCTRYPKDYSYQFLKDSATTNTYEPKLVVTDAYPFALRKDENGIKKAMVVGTPYSRVAGRSFKIKDASCYFDYYDSQVSYFFILIDDQNDEVTLYLDFHQALEQMIHIKGYKKKFLETNYNNVFFFKDNYRIIEQNKKQAYAYDIKFLKKPLVVGDKKWTVKDYKYVSTPERYFQTLYLEMKDIQNEIIYIQLYYKLTEN